MDQLFQAYPPVDGRTTPQRLKAWVLGLLKPPADPETVEQADERRANARADAGLELSRLRAAEAKEMPLLIAAETKARAALDRVTPAYQEAIRAFDLAQNARNTRAAEIEYQRMLATRRVQVSAEPVIQEFASGLLDLFNACRALRSEEEERNPVWFDTNPTPHFEIWSNAPSIDMRAKAIMAAYHTAMEMQFDADQSNIRERLAALIEELPDEAVMVKVYTPTAPERSKRFPSYEESRAEEIGISVEEYRERVRGPSRGSRLAKILRG